MYKDAQSLVKSLRDALKAGKVNNIWPVVKDSERRGKKNTLVEDKKESSGRKRVSWLNIV